MQMVDCMEAEVIMESHELALTGRMKLMVGLPSAISYASGSSLQEVVVSAANATSARVIPWNILFVFIACLIYILIAVLISHVNMNGLRVAAEVRIEGNVLSRIRQVEAIGSHVGNRRVSVILDVCGIPGDIA